MDHLDMQIGRQLRTVAKWFLSGLNSLAASRDPRPKRPEVMTLGNRSHVRLSALFSAENTLT
jgi:hypothetical protein